MRRFLIVVGILLALVAALVAALLLFLDVNQFRPAIQSKLEASLHRSVSLGEMKLKLWPLAIRVDALKIGESPDYPSQLPFLTAQEMDVRVSLSALLSRKIDIESIHILVPHAELIRNAAGKWNFETLGNGSSAGDGATALAELLIEDGRVAVTDRKAGTPRAEYRHLDVKLRDFAPGKRFHLDATAHLPGQGKEEIALKAEGLGAADLDATVNFQGVSLAGLQEFLGNPGREVKDIAVSGQTTIAARGDAVTGKGSLTVIDPKIKQPIQVIYQVRATPSNGVLEIGSLQAKLADVTVSAHGQIGSKASPPTVRMEVDAANAPIAELLTLARLAGFAAGVEGSGRLSVKLLVQGTVAEPVYSGTGNLRNGVIDLASLRKPILVPSAGLRFAGNQATLEHLSATIGNSHVTGSVTVKNFARPMIGFDAAVDRVDVAEMQSWTATPGSEKSPKSARALEGNGTIQIGKLTMNQLILEQVRATCALTGGVIRLDPLTANVFGGQQAGAVTLDTRTTPPIYAIETRLVNVDANQLLSATSAVRNVFHGALSGNANVRFTPVAGQEIARGLNGDVRLQVTNGRLAGVQLLNEMARLGRFLGYAPRNEGFTNIQQLSGSLQIQNGIAHTDDLQMQFDGGSLSGAGLMNLVDQSLNLKLTTVLGKDLMPPNGGKVGGLLSTALANAKGELVIPAIVTGTFASPRFEPDPGRIAKLKIDGLLPTKDNPGSLANTIQGLFEGLKGKK